MPYAPAKRKGTGKRGAKRSTGSRIGKKRRGTRGITKEQVLQIVNKGRETKRLPLSINLLTVACEQDRTAMQQIVEGIYLGQLSGANNPACLN